MSILTNIQNLQQQINQAVIACRRPLKLEKAVESTTSVDCTDSSTAFSRLNAVTILAVSKQRTSDEVIEAFNAGLTHFGENYLQEALLKINALAHLPIEWHFIGAIQSNKTKAIAQHFNWVHTVASKTVADRLNQARSAKQSPLNVCIQVNLDLEDTKAGVDIDNIMPLAAHIVTLPNLRLRGLMTIPKPEEDITKQVASFQRLATIFTAINQSVGNSMDTLSMGMSSDFKAAIQAGSTLIRVGTAIFGTRS